MKNPTPFYHAGQIIPGSNDGDSLGVELDERAHGFLLVTLSEDDAHTGTLYIKPNNARIFAAALLAYATEAEK